MKYLSIVIWAVILGMIIADGITAITCNMRNTTYIPFHGDYLCAPLEKK